MTTQPITFEYEDANELQRCPRCKRLPKNIADERIDFSYTCLCRCSMLGRFAFDKDDAVQNWNDCVAKEQMKMESFTDHGIRNGEFRTDEVSELFSTESAVHSIFTDIFKNTKDRNKILIFCADVAQAMLFQRELQRITADVGLITGETPAHERAELLARFQDKPTGLLQQPHLVLYGTTVKEVLFNAFTAESLTDGLIGRLMIFEGNDSAKRRKLHTIPPVPESIVETADWWFARRANNINQEKPQPLVVAVTEEAEGVFDKFYQVHEQIQSENDPIKDALWGRSVQQARQFALVYACSVSKENPVIDASAAHWAYELVTYLIKRKITIADRHVAEGEFDRKQKMVLRFIESCKGTCTLSMLCRRFRSLKKREREEILENLLATKAVRMEERMVAGSRKRSAVLVLNKR